VKGKKKSERTHFPRSTEEGRGNSKGRGNRTGKKKKGRLGAEGVASSLSYSPSKWSRGKGGKKGKRGEEGKERKKRGDARVGVHLFSILLLHQHSPEEKRKKGNEEKKKEGKERAAGACPLFSLDSRQAGWWEREGKKKVASG